MTVFDSIREKLRDGPRWTRSFQAVKPALDRMIANGEVLRCKPYGGRANNMVCLASRNSEGLRPLDQFAELLSQDYSVLSISLKMGISLQSANSMLKTLHDKYGWQAQ